MGDGCRTLRWNLSGVGRWPELTNRIRFLLRSSYINCSLGTSSALADHLRKAVVQLISPMAFAAVNENRFEVVAHVYQSEPEIRQEPFLVVVETDQAPPYDGGEIRTHRRVSNEEKR